MRCSHFRHTSLIFRPTVFARGPMQNEREIWLLPRRDYVSRGDISGIVRINPRWASTIQYVHTVCGHCARVLLMHANSENCWQKGLSAASRICAKFTSRKAKGSRHSHIERKGDIRKLWAELFFFLCSVNPKPHTHAAEYSHLLLWENKKRNIRP